MKKTVRVVALILAVSAALAAHDTWLVPEDFEVMSGRPVRVALNTSEDFPASEAAVTPDRIARFEMVTAEGRQPVTGYRAEGDSLVAEVTPGPGLTYVVAASKPRLIVLEQDIFNTYITEEGLHQIVEARATLGEAYAEGRERYSKVAKLTLCADGEGADFRQALGLRLEIIPEDNPCELRVGDKFRMQVLFEGRPLAGVRVGAGYPGVHGHDYPLWRKTDAEGQASIQLDRAGPWFVRVLHMVRSNEFADADWQSWFSTLTFTVN